MGFFDEVKKAAAGAKDGFAQAGEAIGNVKQNWTDAMDEQRAAQQAQRDAMAQSMQIIDPTPQDEVDRINAGDGPGRAVVMGVQHNLEQGDVVYRTNATAYVRMRLAGGELGPEQKVKLWTDSGTIRSLFAGTEVPMPYDRVTGVAAIDNKAIAAELKERKKGAKKGGKGF